MRKSYTAFLYYTYSALSNLTFYRGIFLVFLIQKGLSDFQIGALQAILFLVNVLTSVPTGVFGDRVGRRTSVLLGIACLCLSGTGYLVANSYLLFILAFALEGLGLSFISGSDESLLYEQVATGLEKEQDRFFVVISRARGLSLIALGVATLLGGFLQQISWNAVYGAYVACMALAFVVVLFLKERRGSALASSEAMQTMKQLRSPELLTFFRRPNGKRLFLLMLVISVFESAFMSYYMFSQRSFSFLGLSVLSIAAVYTASRFISGITYSITPTVSRLLGRWMMQVTMIFTGILMLVAFFTSSALLVICSFLIGTALPYLLNGVVNNYIHNRIPSSVRAGVISVNQMLFGLLLGLFYIALGALTDVLHPNQAIGLIGVVPFFCLAYLLLHRSLWKDLTTPAAAASTLSSVEVQSDVEIADVTSGLFSDSQQGNVLSSNTEGTTV